MGFDVTVRTNTMSCQHYAMFKRFGIQCITKYRRNKPRKKEYFSSKKKNSVCENEDMNEKKMI